MTMAQVDVNEKKKYVKMDQMLQYINSNFITVSKADVIKVQPILEHVIGTIISGLKENPLFKIMYTDVLYGGSFYDGLKVGKPEEFDIDLRLVLPPLVKAKLEKSDQPGFVKCHMTDWATFENSNIYDDYKGLKKLKDSNNYLLVNEVLNWMKSMIDKFLNDKKDAQQRIRIPYKDTYAEIKLSASGPAHTLLITCGEISLDVDLVIVFRMQEKDWPTKPFKKIPQECSQKREFMIVPKAPKTDNGQKNRCWRMSFQQQESVLLNGKNTCKTALRIMKKIRDKSDHKMISSYFIKTIFLHELQQPREFWNSPLSFILMHMLKKYRTYLEKGQIRYYWNEQNNLLQHIDKITIGNLKGYISNLIDTVDRNIVDNPYKIAEYILTKNELTQLRRIPAEIIETSTTNDSPDKREWSCIIS